VKHVETLETFVKSQVGNAEWVQAKYTNLVDSLSEMLNRISYALEAPSNYFIASVVKAKSHERWRLQCSLTAFQMDETSCSQSLKEKFRRCIWQVGSWKLEWFARRNGSILSASSDSFSTSLGRATRKFTTSSCARGRRDGSCNETIATIAGQHASECPTSLQHRQSRRLLYK
jgi:hypothetical protein